MTGATKQKALSSVLQGYGAVVYLSLNFVDGPNARFENFVGMALQIVAA